MTSATMTSSPAAGGAFFSPIPRAVYGLRGEGRLKARDVDVLGLLLDYKGRRRTTVDPSQETLAGRLRCSPDTVQRSLARLAAAGLIVRTRLRDLAGRLGRCVYDLAPTLALMPAQAAKMRRGEWGAGGDELSSSARARHAAKMRRQGLRTPGLLFKQTTGRRPRRLAQWRWPSRRLLLFPK